MKSPKPLKDFMVITRKRTGDNVIPVNRPIQSACLRDARSSGRAMAQAFDEYYITTAQVMG